MGEKLGKLIILTGPSGVGKGTILADFFSIVNKNQKNVVYSISSTTRKPRDNEIDGVHYFFVTNDKFNQMIKDDEFLEWAQYSGNYYGTNKKFVESNLKKGISVLLEIELQGALNVMKKNILIGITASIASYKIYELIRLFKKNSYEVKVVVTQNALEFVSPLVIETLSENKCYVNQFNSRDNIEHISLQNWADVFVIAPMSANTLAKCSLGVCDNLLTSIFCAYLGSKKPVVIAPAMNDFMYENPIIQNHIENLKKLNCIVLDTEVGFLACNKEGKGRLQDINIIFENTLRLLYQKKENNLKKIVITYGGTKEKIDTVREITNSSSGKMGLSLADWAYRLGYEVIALGTIDPIKKPYETIIVKSADEMYDNLKKLDFDYLIMAAAVADFKVKKPENKKISKENIQDNLVIELQKNIDIVSNVAKNKTKNQKIIGFCLADDDIVSKAKDKLKNKNLDFIVANNVNIALNSNENEVTIIDKNGKITNINRDKKENIARKILEEVL